MQENNSNLTYLKGAITNLNDDICRGAAIMENSQIISFHFILFKRNPFSKFPKVNDKIIATFQDDKLISVKLDLC
jgi:hypothetical protein